MGLRLQLCDIGTDATSEMLKETRYDRWTREVCAVETGQTSAAESEKMSAVEPDQMSDAESEQMSAVLKTDL